MPQPANRRLGIKFWVLAAVVAALLLAVVLLSLLRGGEAEWLPHLSLEELVLLVRESGSWGVLVSIGLMVLHSFIPFPAELVAVANGLIYGPVWGVAITWLGAMLGSSVAFALARHFGRRWLGRLLSDAKLHSLDAWVRNYGTGSLLFSRFIPLVAFNLINFAAGLSGVSWATFLWTTGLGILPLTTLMVVMGDHLQAMPLWAWLGMLVMGLLFWWAAHRWAHSRAESLE